MIIIISYDKYKGVKKVLKRI